MHFRQHIFRLEERSASLEGERDRLRQELGQAHEEINEMIDQVENTGEASISPKKEEGEGEPKP